jgi:cytochrome c oxidase assembly protein subunit 15
MTASNPQRAVAWWLFACCAMVFLTMVVGGVTRLTHSGLSIVEWKPLVGALPPLSHADWLELFAKYQQTPEFIKRNHDMTLDGFQFIFWWEWAHRLSGRLIGVVFFVPYVWFLLRGRLSGALAAKVFGFFILGGLQGAMGWYMVKSGLVDDPRVSQYRLAAHLGLAFLLFGLMYWTGLGMLQPRNEKVAVARPRSGFPGMQSTPAPTFTTRLGNWLVALVFIMVLSGALVAGIRAGLAYNTFPLMNGYFLPPESFMVEPLWLNFFTNMATVQFDHRMIAWLLMGLIPWYSWRIWNETPDARTPAVALTLWLAVQVALGIATLLLQVPVALGAAHQAGAMVLFGLLLWANHSIRRSA